MKKTEFNCDHCVQKFHQSLQFGNTYTNSSWVTQNTGLKLQITAVYENKKFNCDQCGKNFARGCNLKVLIQNVYEIYSWIELWTLWQIFHQSIQFVGNLSQNHNFEYSHQENS